MHQCFVNKMRLLEISAVIAQTSRYIQWLEMLLFRKEKYLGLKGSPKGLHLYPPALLPCHIGTSHSAASGSHIVLTGDWDEMS